MKKCELCQINNARYTSFNNKYLDIPKVVKVCLQCARYLEEDF